MANFSLTEYQEYRKIGDSSIPLVVYCFLRRNLSQEANVENVFHYFNAVLQYWDYYEDVVCSKAYLIFKDEFLSNKYQIRP